MALGRADFWKGFGAYAGGEILPYYEISSVIHQDVSNYKMDSNFIKNLYVTKEIKNIIVKHNVTCKKHLKFRVGMRINVNKIPSLLELMIYGKC